MLSSQERPLQYKPHDLVIIRAADRSSAGHPGSYRGERFWPSASETVVEVWDTEDCPRVDNPSKPGTTMLDPHRVGLKNWRLIERDTTLALRLAPAGSKLETMVKKTSDQLEAENRALRENVIDLTDRLTTLETEKGTMADVLATLQSQVKQLMQQKAAAPPAPPSVPVAPPPAPVAPAPDDEDLSADDDDAEQPPATVATRAAAKPKAKKNKAAAAKAGATPDLGDAGNPTTEE